MSCPCGPESWKCRIPHLFRFHTPQFVFKGACVWHDAAYEKGGTPSDRLQIDEMFYWLMKEAVASKPHWYQRLYYRFFAFVYYRAVRLYGDAHFKHTLPTPE